MTSSPAAAFLAALLVVVPELVASTKAPLRLRSPEGGIQLEVGGAVQNAVTAVRDRRVQLVGYGPSASTLGANRAGRAAAIAVQRWLADAEDELTA